MLYQSRNEKNKAYQVGEHFEDLDGWFKIRHLDVVCVCIRVWEKL